MEYLAAFALMVAAILLCAVVWFLSGAARLARTMAAREDAEARRYRMHFAISLQMASLGTKFSRLDRVLDQFGTISQDKPNGNLTDEVAPRGDVPIPDEPADEAHHSTTQTNQ